MILPQAKPVGSSNPLKNPLRPLSEVAYSVQAFDGSGQVRPESCQVVVCLQEGGNEDRILLQYCVGSAILLVWKDFS